jgi:hypothetical protein
LAVNLSNPLSLPVTRAAWIAAVALGLGLLFDVFFWNHTPGLSVPVFVLLILTGLLTLARIFGRPLPREVYALGMPLLFFAAMAFVRASEPLLVLNLGACLVLLLWIAESATRGVWGRSSLAGYLGLATLPVRFLGPLYGILLALVTVPAEARERGVRRQVLRGVLLALPVLALFLVLLASADLVFRNLVTRLVDLPLRPETVARIVLVVLVTLALIGGYGYALLRPVAPPAERRGRTSRLGLVEATVVLGSVNGLFLLFLIIQFAYLFGGERMLTLPGMTYAEYARRGFFELIAVALISWLLLLLLDQTVDRPEARHRLRFRILGLLMIAQVAVIMASAHFRLSLYEAAYGFTTLRFFSHALIVLLAVCFALLGDRLLRAGPSAAFADRIVVALIVFWAVINLWNPEAFVARRNLERFAITGKLDTNYLKRLSDDAVPQIVSALQRADAVSRDSLVLALESHASRWQQPEDWQSLNLSRLRARRILLPWVKAQNSGRDDLPRPADSTAVPVQP